MTVAVGVRGVDGVSESTMTLVGFDTMVGVKVIAQLEKKPAVKVMPLVPAGSEVSTPIVPVKPEAVMAGLGLITLLTTAITLATKTAEPVREVKPPVKVTVVAVVEQLKELILTPSTFRERQVTDGVMVYSEGKLMVRVSEALT